MNASTKNTLREAYEAVRGGLQPAPKTAPARVLRRYSDAFGAALSYDIEVQQPSGYTQHHVSAPYGFSYGEGALVTVNRRGGDGTGDWELSANIGGYGTETPALFGGVISYEPTLIEGLGFHIPKGDGCMVVGGTLVRDSAGRPSVTGTRVRICANGIKGLSDTGDGDRIAFMLATEDHTTYENNLPYDIGAGDAQLGYRAQGHLYVDSDAGTFSWNVGTTTLIQSQMIDDLPFTQIAGLLRLSDTFIGAGIEMGKDYRDAYVLQMLNIYNVPLIVMRAGYDADPDRAYMRIGPPPPAPGITATSVNGTPVLVVDGEIIRNTSVPASALNVLRLSDINGNLGVIQAGRAEFLQPGTSFIDWANPNTATGIVIGFNDQTQRGELWGLNAGVKQAYFDTDGKIKAGGGDVTLDVNGISLARGDTVDNQLKWYHGSTLVGAIYGQGGTDSTPALNIGSVGNVSQNASNVSLSSSNSDGTVFASLLINAVNSGSVSRITSSSNLFNWENMSTALRMQLSDEYLVIGGVDQTTPAALLHVSEFGTGTGGYNTVAIFERNTSNTPVADYGLRHMFKLESSTTAKQDAAAVDVAWSTATHASRTAYMRWLLVNNAAALAEFMRLTPTELDLQNNLIVRGKPCFDPGGALTIATGAITVTAGFHFVDTEGAAASDDLDTINGGVDGALLVLRANSSARDVVCKDGTGNLQLAGDFTLTHINDSITLMSYSGSWVELSRSDNSA